MASCRRSGLAPLELVLALPVLLFVAALIVNLGMVATWRVRGEIVSREAVWRSRWPRTGFRESPPAVWPADALMGLAEEPQIGDLDHPDIRQPVVRGPLPNGFLVNGALAPDRGCRQGRSAVTKPYPLLPRLGRYESGNIRNPILDEKWPCWEFGIPNVFPRSQRLYGFPATDPSLPSAVAQAAHAMFNIPHYVCLWVLDRDTDIQLICGQIVDFHPRLAHPYPGDRLVDLRYCELDPEVVRCKQVNRLIDTLDAEGHAVLGEISLLPRRLTKFFRDMYQSEVQRLQNQIQGWQQELASPRTTPQRRRELMKLIRDAQAEIARLQPCIAPLEQYWKRLPEIEQQLRELAEAKGA